MFTKKQLSNAMQTAADNFDSGKWGWQQGAYGYSGPIPDQDLSEIDTGSYCMVGGCAKVLSARPGRVAEGICVGLMSCIERLHPQGRHRYPTAFNDSDDTKLVDVVAVLRCGATEIIA